MQKILRDPIVKIQTELPDVHKLLIFEHDLMVSIRISEILIRQNVIAAHNFHVLIFCCFKH